MSKLDTISNNYYDPLDKSEFFGEILFYLLSIFSILILYIDKSTHPFFNNLLQVALIVLAIVFFFQGQIQNIYLFPRAEDARRQELLSNSYQTTLTHELTDGYYNNEQTNPLKRLAASVMESSFFTREIVRKMLTKQRIQTGGYLIIYGISVFNRTTELELLSVAAQAIFSQDIVARWLRMEWLRMRSEQVFNNSNRLFTSNLSFSQPTAQSQAIDLFSFYETTK
ncbi:hypothetical protein [Acetobacter indonesiensis]